MHWLVALVSIRGQVLSLTLEGLQTIYRVQFPVLCESEQNTGYDQTGRIIYTKNRGLPGVGFKSKKWTEIKDMTSGTVERTIVYEGTFDECDREEDYARVWIAFEERRIGGEPV